MNKPLCILLIHGFGGSQREVLPLAQLLRTSHIHCRVACLAGHDEHLKRIENLPWVRWVDSVRTVYNELATEFDVVAVGFSMGGLIAAILNSERPFQGIVLINTPIYFWNLPQIVKNLVSDFSGSFRYYFIKSAGRVSTGSMLQFLGLLLAARPFFRQVSCPALVVQADNDDTVWPHSANYICKQVRGFVDLCRTKGGSHQVLLDAAECRLIADRVERFLSALGTKV